ncbi:MAG: hypothetical protein HQ523_07190 [Lentisphaerae bacterium]|nr:hypothetical protein [Lentisphaerota bacterium]
MTRRINRHSAGRIGLLLLAALLLPLSLPAADEDAATEAPAALLDGLSLSATVSYDSRYVLYAYSLTEHLYHASVNAYLPINDRWSAWAGSWYGTLDDGTYRELDLYAGFDAVIGSHFSAGGGWSLFNYLKVPYPSDDSANELMAHVTATAGPFALRLSDQYDFSAEGNLVRLILTGTQPLCDHVTLIASIDYGYALDYYIEGNAPNHVICRLSLPLKVSEAVTVKPFVAHSTPLKAIKEYEVERTYWGVHVDYAF